MKQGFSIVPFKVDSTHGMSEMIGLAKFSAAGIVLEFEQEYLGLVRSGGVREIRIPLTDILDIQLGKGFYRFFTRINIRFKSLATLGGIPTSKGRLKLKIARADHESAAQAVETMQRTLSGERQDLPPTTVRELFGDEAETKELE